MPLVANSAMIGAYMKRIVQPDGTITDVHIHNYNLPVYLIDSRDMNTPNVRVSCSNANISATMREILFSDAIPIPVWAEPAVGTDASMALYDL